MDPAKQVPWALDRGPGCPSGLREAGAGMGRGCGQVLSRTGAIDPFLASIQEVCVC